MSFRSFLCNFKKHFRFKAPAFTKKLGQTRVELVTPALSERCSNQLSYCPGKVENRGFEPLTLGLQSRCSSQLS